MEERPEPEKRRRRPAVSCTLCRKRKLRCNRDTPCSNCLRSRSGTCVYENLPQQHPKSSGDRDRMPGVDPASKPRGSGPVTADTESNASQGSTVPSYSAGSLLANSTRATTPASQVSIQDVESMKSKIRQLEDQLSQSSPKSARLSDSTANSKIETSTSAIGGTFHFHRDGSALGGGPMVTRSVTHKGRLFGKSHWSNDFVLIRHICEMTNPLLGEDASRALTGLRRAKHMAKIIKARRTPEWPTPLASDLPPKEVADELVDCYLRTIETTFRIVHIPNFRSEYEALWVSDGKADAGFLVLLKLILAIGTTTYDDHFSMRTFAIRWVYEAITWAAQPEFKSRLGLQLLQTNVLLVLAREYINVEGDSVWVSNGALIRMAISMGLHRDPKHMPRKSTYTDEMRRRLWNTILEIEVQSSLLAGGPPAISLEDFDTEPPENFSDEQLLIDNPIPKPPENFTQTSVAIALRKTFPIRLKIAKFLNDLDSSGSYERTLQLDAEMRMVSKDLYRSLQQLESPPPRFAMRTLDFYTQRYISALHIPFYGLSLKDPAYAHSRKVVVETLTKLWCLIYPMSSIMAAQSNMTASPIQGDEFYRFIISAYGFFRAAGIQASFLMISELRMQIQEADCFGPIPLRQDLVSVMEEAQTWCLQHIQAGETNMKGYMMISVLAAEIEGLKQGLPKMEVSRLMIKAAEFTEETSISIFESHLGQSQADGAVDEFNQMSLNSTPQSGDDWDFMMSDTMFDGAADPVSWILNDGASQSGYGGLFGTSTY